MLNKIIIMGRMTRDPEVRKTRNGISVASFALAVSRDYQGQNRDKETDFIECSAWRSTADFVSRYFTRGRMAVVEGSLQMQDWTDKDGNKRRSAVVVAESVYFADSKRTASEGNADEREFTPEQAQDDRMTEVGDDGKLPF